MRSRKDRRRIVRLLRCGEVANSLSLRLTGEVTRSDGGSVDGTEVQLSINYNDTVFEAMKAPADKGKFQVWLPVNKYHWFNIIVTATSSDGARCTRTIRRQQLRELVAGGLNLNVELPKREVLVRVEHDGVKELPTRRSTRSF